MAVMERIHAETRLRDTDGAMLALAGIAVMLLLQAHLALVQRINWDEFFYLSRIFEFERGTLDRALQTVHVHLFGWLKLVGGGEVDQVVAGRFAMLACEGATLALIYGTARAFCSKLGALAAAAAYLSFGFVLQHGASFRADPIAATLIMACCFLLARSALRPVHLALLGLAGALAFMITVKSVFYLPALAALALWRLRSASKKRLVAMSLAAAGAAGGAAFALMYFWHESLLPEADLETSKTLLTSAYDRTILPQLFPQGRYLDDALLVGLFPSLLIGAGLLHVCWRQIRMRGRDVRLWALLALFSPLLTLIFYRNAFPYFYAFILPAPAVLAGYAIDRLKREQLRSLAILLIGTSGGVHYMLAPKGGQDAQRQVVTAVHGIFPSPVPYIDRNSMIGSFPKAGFFMSSWGVEAYRDRGEPVFREILVEQRPPLLILNSSALKAAVGLRKLPRSGGLLPEDARILSETYIPHWGPLWVAGKSLAAGPEERAFEILVAGRYTVHAAASVTIDGASVQPGAVLLLSAGRHVVAADSPVSVLLRWGDHLSVPRAAPPKGPIYKRF